LFSDPASVLPLIREGKLVGLAVSSITRLPSAPEIPPIAEAGVPGFEAVAWLTIVAPANTPKEVVTRLHTELKNIVALPEIQQQMVKFGMIPAGSLSPDELQRFISSEIMRWGGIVRQAGIAGSQ